MLVTLTLPLTHVKDEVKSVVAVTTPLILVKNEVKYDRYTFTTLLNGAERWEQICTELRLQTLMSKLILRKEINKLYLNTVLKIFTRQYRTRAGNHGNCCFIIIFENVLEYVLFRSEIFFVLCWVDHFPLDRSVYDVMIATQNNDSTIGRWKTEPKQDTLFLARNCRGCKLSLRPRKLKNNADLKKKKASFLYEAVHLLLTNIFTLIFDRV